jgi:hypothetical protein
MGSKCSCAVVCLACLSIGWIPGCGDGPGQSQPESVLRLSGDGFELEFDLTTGALDVIRADGQPVLEQAFFEAAVRDPDGGEPLVYRSTGRYRRAGRTATGAGPLGPSEQLIIELRDHEQAGPDLTLTLAAHAGRPGLTAQLEASPAAGDGLVLDRLVPLKVDAARGGGLWLGSHPRSHRILEAGSFFLFDFFVDILPGDVSEPVETVALGMIHGYQKGHSISNWNHAVVDLETGRGLIAGSLDFEHASPMFNLSYDSDQSQVLAGRTGFSYWSGEFPYLPNGKPLGPGESLVAGPVLLIPDAADPLVALEDYAQAIADANELRLWNQRGAENRVPTGWNSWTGSGSSGGYGSGIDQALMVDNLQVMADEFRDFGGEWFQIDDGYEYHYGDWDWRPDRFPDGAAWLADQIEAQGLIPGVWIALFQVSAASQLYADHQADGWFPPKLPLVGGDTPVLDLTHPEVLAWLTERARQIRAAGYRWLKTDFGYWALGASQFHDPSATREEAYRRGLAAVKAGLDLGAQEAGGQPGDTFWLSVAMIGPHIGWVDSIRPNLDTMPAWDREDPSQARKEAQGFKPTARTIARRYYLQNRVYLFNHDMLFFRSHQDPDVPRITRDEARCLLSAVGLSGSVAKLGERLVDMLPEWIADYRRVLPVFGRSARPLDLFEREYAELWHLRVDPAQGLNTHGAGSAYDVVGLFHWGENADLTTNPYTPMADEERVVSLDLAAIGLEADRDYLAREFWSGELIEGLRANLSRALAPHSVQLWALRPQLERPQFVGDDRHILQGAVEIKSLEWDAGAETLRLTYDAAPGTTLAPCTHRLVFWAPAGWSWVESQVPGARAGSVQTQVVGRQVQLEFQVDARLDLSIAMVFERS